MRKYGFKALLTGWAVCFALSAAPAWAGYDYKIEHPTNPVGNYEAEIGEKLTRGVNNTLFGWSELGRTPVNMAQGPGKNLFKVVFIGIPYGIFRAVGRTVLGVYEVVTCWAPQKPIMQPIEGAVPA